MKNNNEVIEKIKKLLRMKNGASPEEYDTALKLAKQIANKYKVDMATINPDEYDVVTHYDTPGKSRISKEEIYVAIILTRYFNVRTVRNIGFQRCFTIIGTEIDIQIAQYVFEFLVKRFRYEWNLQKKKKKLKKRDSFMWGVYTRLYSKLNQSKYELPESYEIVLTKNTENIERYLKSLFPDAKSDNVKPKNTSKVAEAYGKLAGRNIEINKALTGKTPAMIGN